MASQADGSIIVDTELNSDGFKAGSAELLSAIKALSNEVKNLGQTLKETFGGSDRNVGATDSKVQALEATIASLQAQVQSLQTTVTELQEKINSLNSGQATETPVDGIAAAAQGADEKVTALEAKIKELEGVIANMQAQLAAAASAPADVDFNVDAAEAKIAALEDKVSELENTIAQLQSGGGGTATPMVNFGGATEKTSSLQRQIDSVNSSVERLEPTFQRAMGGSESAMTSFEAKAGSLERKIVDLQAKLEAAGQTQMPTAEYQSVSAEVTKTAQKFDTLLARQEKMQAMGVTENSAQWRSLQYDMEIVSNKYHKLIALKQQLETSGGAYVMGAETSRYAQMEANLTAANQRLAEMRTGLSQSEGVMSRVASCARSVFSWIGKAATTVGGKFLTGIKAAVSHMAKMVRHSKLTNKQFGGLISSAKKFCISLLGAHGVYALLRKAVTAYMQENEQLSAQLAACWTEIGNIIGPIITRLVDLLSTAVAYITQFLRLLGVVGDSASNAINSAGNNVARETGKLKRQLGSFDELNVLRKNETHTSDPKGELPKVELPDWVGLTLEKIKEAFRKGDYAGIGEIIGNGINSAIQKIKDFISWENVGQTITNAIGAISQSFNAIVDTVKWENIGNALAEGFNTALNALYLVLTEFNWPGLAAGLSRSINGLVSGIDWSKLGTTLSTSFHTVLATLRSAISSFDWGSLGRSITDALNNIDLVEGAGDLAGLISDLLNGILDLAVNSTENLDWDKLGRALWESIINVIRNIDWSDIISKVFRLLGASLGSSVALIRGFCSAVLSSLVSGFESTKSYFNRYIEDAGGNIVAGLWNGIKNAFKNVGTWIVENIWNPFIEGFKNAFGIHSPSTKMAEMGGYIVEGLLNGIKNAWHTITDFFSGAFDSIKVTASQTWDAIKNGAYTAWTDIKSSLSTAWDGIKTTATTKWNNLKTTISTAWDSVKTTASTKWAGIKTSLSTAWDDIKTTASTKWGNIKNTIKNKEWSSVGSNICDGIASGIDSGWSWLKNKVGDVSSSLLDKAKSALGIHSPSRLFRDIVGLNIGYGIGEGIDASEKSVVSTVTNLADAIAAEANTGEYNIGGIVSTSEVDGALSSFSDRISNSFTSLLDRLQAIAESVTFTTPAVANGVVPYRVTPTGTAGGDIVSSTIEASNDELASVVTQVVSNATASIVAAIQQYGGATVNIDKDSMTDTIIKEINRRTRAMGKSPLLI